MFEPGHLHRQQPFATADIPQYVLDVRYEVCQDPSEGALMHFNLSGVIDGKPFTDAFDLHRDLAFNFASALAKATAKHGLPADHGPILAKHAEYDAMFTDIRDKLQVHPGESIDLDHLEKDGF
jgi:hypothetical protein